MRIKLRASLKATRAAGVKWLAITWGACADIHRRTPKQPAGQFKGSAQRSRAGIRLDFSFRNGYASKSMRKMLQPLYLIAITSVLASCSSTMQNNRASHFKANSLPSIQGNYFIYFSQSTKAYPEQASSHENGTYANGSITWRWGNDYKKVDGNTYKEYHYCKTGKDTAEIREIIAEITPSGALAGNNSAHYTFKLTYTSFHMGKCTWEVVDNDPDSGRVKYEGEGGFILAACSMAPPPKHVHLPKVRHSR